VVLEGGREIRATQVISNADGYETVTQLIGEEHLPASYVRRMRRLNPSLSAVVLFAATDLDLAEMHPAHETFWFDHWDHDATLQDIQAGKPGGAWASVPTLIDPTVAPAGEHLIAFTTLAPYELGTPWEEAKEGYTEVLLDQLNAMFPGVRDRMTYLEVATPLTLERYLHDFQGAIYGWSNTPGQATTQRPSHVTPINGLFLSGHWTQPGTGSFRVIYSGLQTSQIMMDVRDFGQFLGMLGAGPPPQ
jgi:prolycopene isomerase